MAFAMLSLVAFMKMGSERWFIKVFMHCSKKQESSVPRIYSSSVNKLHQQGKKYLKCFKILAYILTIPLSSIKLSSASTIYSNVGGLTSLNLEASETHAIYVVEMVCLENAPPVFRYPLQKSIAINTVSGASYRNFLCLMIYSTPSRQKFSYDDSSFCLWKSLGFSRSVEMCVDLHLLSAAFINRQIIQMN